MALGLLELVRRRYAAAQARCDLIACGGVDVKDGSLPRREGAWDGATQDELSHMVYTHGERTHVSRERRGGEAKASAIARGVLRVIWRTQPIGFHPEHMVPPTSESTPLRSIDSHPP